MLLNEMLSQQVQHLIYCIIRNNRYVGECWEHFCRQFVSDNIIDGIVYNIATR